MSKSHVSRICSELDGAVTKFRERRLDHIEFPYLFLDATYVKAHDGAHVLSKTIILATGVAADGNREVLGVVSTNRLVAARPATGRLCELRENA